MNRAACAWVILGGAVVAGACGARGTAPPPDAASLPHVRYPESDEGAGLHYKAVHYDQGTGIAVADVDGDGREDIYFVNQPQVLVSDLAQRGPIAWLKVALVGTASNRNGLGATVRVHAGGRTYTKYTTGSRAISRRAPCRSTSASATRARTIGWKWTGRPGASRW